jgi:predicted DNA-binding transcriptional regulator AlpA
MHNLLTLSEVGKILGGFSERTIRRMIDRGELPKPIKILRRSLLTSSDVSAFIERVKRTNSEPSL